MAKKTLWVSGQNISKIRLDSMCAQLVDYIYGDVAVGSLVRIFQDDYNTGKVENASTAIPTPFKRDSTVTWTKVASLSATKSLIVYVDSDRIQAKVLVNSGQEVTYISPTDTTINAAGSSKACQMITMDSTRAFLVFAEGTTLKGIIINVDGNNVITFGSTQTFTVGGNHASCALIGTEKVIVVYNNGSGTGLYARSCTTSTTTLSAPGTEYNFGADPVDTDTAANVGNVDAAVCDLGTDKALLVYEYSNQVNARVLTTSGTTITGNARAMISNSNLTGMIHLIKSDTNKALALWGINGTTDLYLQSISAALTTPSETRVDKLDAGAVLDDFKICLNDSTHATVIFKANTDDVYTLWVTLASGAYASKSSSYQVDPNDGPSYASIGALNSTLSIIVYQGKYDDGTAMLLSSATAPTYQDGVALSAGAASSKLAVLPIFA